MQAHESFFYSPPYLSIIAVLLSLLVGCTTPPLVLTPQLEEPKDDEVSLTYVEPTPEEAQAPLPSRLLICGLSALLNNNSVQTTLYQEDNPQVLSLYDFEVEDHLRTWIRTHPDGKAYRLRHPLDGGAPIARRLSGYCFGDGDRAREVVHQAVIQRAGGASPKEALHNLLRQGRSTHFLIDRDGHVYQTLDPVHAAFDPKDEASNEAIFIALIAPRKEAEWLPSIFLLGAIKGAAKTSTKNEKTPPIPLPSPSDRYAERQICQVRTHAVEGELFTPKQYKSLQAILKTLGEEFPLLTLQLPKGEGSFSSQTGVFANHQLDNSRLEPACLDLNEVLPR